MPEPETRIVPARHARAFRVASGETIEISTPTGTQVGDTWAFRADDPFEHLSLDHTRSINSQVYADTGMVFVTSKRRPLLTFTADTSPGRHDTILCPCNAAIYQELGVREYHRNCTDNLHEALAEHGISLPFTPAALNLFMNIPINPDGTVTRLPPHARPGDAVQLRAETDTIVVISACPQDITPINGPDKTPTDLHVRIHPAGK